jgi:hypothetical protein
MNLLTSSTEEQYHKVPELPLQLNKQLDRHNRQLILRNRQQQIQRKVQVGHSKQLRRLHVPVILILDNL